MLPSLTIGVALFSRVLMKWVPCSSLKYQLGPILRLSFVPNSYCLKQSALAGASLIHKKEANKISWT